MIRSKKTHTILLAAVLSVTAALTACSSTQPSANDSSTSAKNTPTSTDSTKTTDGPLTKYNPMIEISTVRAIPDGTKFVDGESIDDNVWTKEEQGNLGIKVKNVWAVPGAQYDQKLNIAIASGDLPDFFKVSGVQLQNLVESDLVEDMTSVLKNYTSDILNKTLAEDPYAIKSATFDGKVMALPIPGSPGMGETNLWVRTDWLEKLGLKEPASLDDVVSIAQAFVSRDPDGNGQNDTIGLGLGKDLWKTGLASIEGFFAAYHSYPTIWVKDASGNAVFGGIQPDVKKALSKLQDMYKAGLIDKEFGVKDGGKIAELIASNKLGLYYGSWWNPYYPLQDAVNKNPNMRWKHIQLVSADTNPALTPGYFSTNSYFVVKKGAKHPEAIVKMANYLLTKYYVKYEVVPIGGKYEGISVWNYPSLWIEPPTKNVVIQQRIKSAVKSGDMSKLTDDDKNNLKQQKEFLEQGDVKRWQDAAAFGSDGSLDMVNEILSGNKIMQTVYNAAPTKTMIEKQAALDKLQLEAFTKIIMGVAPVDQEFDKYVSDWKKFGGDQITKEVNDWVAKQK